MKGAGQDGGQFVHGGPDAAGVPTHDFSSNGNACGPWPVVLQALRAVDARHYPDPAYTRLQAQLADWHGVAPGRIVLAASASEFIQRISVAVALQAGGRTGRVCWPAHAYGDYARAAQAAGLQAWPEAAQADLFWACEPSSPLGQAEVGLAERVARLGAQQTLVLDLAYEPLRLEAGGTLDAAALDRVWRLFTPNKALGLTGLRAAYAIAPQTSAPGLLSRVQQLAPSWPVGSHGVCLLQHWATPAAQAWLTACRASLRRWKQQQSAALRELGWTVWPSEANFFLARAAPDGPPGWQGDRLAQGLRAHGIKLRDGASFGLPGHWRLAVQTPPAQQALLAALAQLA